MTHSMLSFKRSSAIILMLLVLSISSLYAQVYEEKEEVLGITSVCDLRDKVMKAGKLTMNALRGKEFERVVGKPPIWQSKIATTLFDKNLTSFGNADGGFYMGEKQFASNAESIAFHDELLKQITTCTGVSGFNRNNRDKNFKPDGTVTDWISDYYKTVSLGDKRFFIISLTRSSENIVRLKIIAHSRSYYMENVDYYEDDKFIKKAKQFKFSF